jgi:alpha/beta superfamily hydrolase
MGDDRDLHLPAGGPTSAAAVVLHPHPGMGGDRHHPLVVSVADGLCTAGVAALRVDLRDASVASAAGALAETAAALRDEVDVDRLFLVGYSWGAAVVALADVDDLSARVLVAPPVTTLDLPPQPEPTLVLVPEHDHYGPPPEVETALAPWPNTTIEVVGGCDHFLAGAVSRISDRAVAWLGSQR